MAKPGTANTASNVVAFLVSFLYRFTVVLATEIIKIGIVVGIVMAAFLVSGLGFVSLLVWTYTVYEGSLTALMCAAVVGIVTLMLVAAFVEYLVKDVLCLTDMPLAQLMKILLAGIFSRRKKQHIRSRNVTDQTQALPPQEGQCQISHRLMLQPSTNVTTID